MLETLILTFWKSMNMFCISPFTFCHPVTEMYSQVMGSRFSATFIFKSVTGEIDIFIQDQALDTSDL